MKEVEERLDRLEQALQATTASGRRIDLNRPGFLALLRQVLAVLRRIDGLLDDRTRELRTNPRIAVGA